ncbi:MAG: ribonuclease T(2), partial [Mesorhizobium sp.]
MSPKSAQRFWENDMHQNKDLKRVARIRF